MTEGDADWGMTELEERLRGRDGPAVKAEALSRLSQAAQDLHARVSSGLAPVAFTRATAMQAAVDCARSILAAMP